VDSDNLWKFKSQRGPLVSVFLTHLCAGVQCPPGVAACHVTRLHPYRTPPPLAASRQPTNHPVPFPLSLPIAQRHQRGLPLFPQATEPLGRFSSTEAKPPVRSSSCAAPDRFGVEADPSRLPFALCPGAAPGELPSMTHLELQPLSPPSPSEDPLRPILSAG
jgi:hypothetical protein